MKKLSLLLFVLFALNQLNAQNKSVYGKFNSQFYSINDFNSNAQIWTGAQGLDGNVYFGNDSDILSFNGINWETVKCDSTITTKSGIEKIYKTKVSKIFKSKSGKLYIGRYDNFGILQYSKKGKIIYKPLKIASKEDEIGQIWNIVEYGQKIFFIAKSKVFKLEKGIITPISMKIPNYTCNTSGSLENGLFMAFRNDNSNSLDEKDRRYFYFDFPSEKHVEISFQEDNFFNKINGITQISGDYYLFDKTGNLRKIKITQNKIQVSPEEEKFAKLKEYDVSSIQFHKNRIYVGTEKHGLIILNTKGEILRKLNLKDGMENINVFDFFHDRDDNLWLGLDNGIHFFETSAPITYYDKNNGIIDAINTIDIKNNVAYLANGTGIARGEIVDFHLDFKSLNVLTQEAYDLKTYQTSFGNKTLVVANDGIYEINYTTNSSKLIVQEYAWTTFQNPENKNEFFVGLETSLGKLTLSKSGWKYETLIENVDGDILKITYFKGKIIFGAHKKGVFVYDLKTKKHHLAPLPNNKKITTHYVVEEFQNKVYVGLETGLYFLTDDFKNLKPFKEFDGAFSGDKNIQIHRLANLGDDKLWLVIHKENSDPQIEHGYLTHKNGKWKWTAEPFSIINLTKNGLAYDIKKNSFDETWIATNTAVFVFNEQQWNRLNKKFSVVIDRLSLNNRLILNNPEKAEKLDEIEYSKNSINFTFHANSLIGFKEMRFRYKLENYTDDWSEWSDLNFADFKKLHEGTYTLHIQGKNSYGIESEVLSYNFTILPPWYRSWLAYIFYFLSVIFLLYLIIQLSLKRVKNQNLKLEEIVKERTSEIAEQNNQLESQKEEIVLKTKDIVDSIIYAKRIQDTILPGEEQLIDIFKEHFVFYRPKDIVSGDFYWARKKGDLLIFSAIDCTGHGVPGALVSIVGNASLLRCVNEHKLLEPSEILDKHRDIVVRSFASKSQNEVKDGMDMSLCTIDTKTNLLKFSGANNSCLIIRNKEIIELKADKQPIGFYSHAFPFTQQEFQLQENDCVYQYTDGYVDQFGGEKGKKLKSKPFKEYLIEISHLPMSEQFIKIENFFESWKKEFDQVDDVCVFAIKI